jgi:K+-transporting ATPase ATPase A chain
MNDIIQISIFLLLLIIITPVLGGYMFKVFTGQNHFLTPVLGWLETLIYRFSNINQHDESDWKGYTRDLLLFNIAGLFLLYLLQVFQQHLPINPARLPGISWHSAFNTSVSFVTNTNWQAYAGETTMSYFVQMAGLTVQNFVSAATGIAVMLAVTRGFTRKATDKLGNFLVDLTRSVIYVLLPLSIIFSIILVSQGVIQNFRTYETVHTLQGASQVIPMGPAASQIAIKQLGTNGGGFFNANSSHPFENPTPLSNFLELLAILAIPASLTYTYGRMTRDVRHGWTIFTVMFILLLAGLAIALKAEHSPSPLYGNLPLMEGKETRIGISGSVLWMIATTAASNGSVNAMHDSLSPLAGMTGIVNIMLGEVIFGGVGAGMYGIIVFIIVTVFIAGLMVGRTPEYLGKKIESFEIQMALISIFATSLIIPVFSFLAITNSSALDGLNNHGPHGLTEILYAYSSAAGNNGSAFAGLNANTIFYNITLGLVMLTGRFGIIVPVLAMAGKVAGKKTIPASNGTFNTDNWLFIILLTGIILVVGGLTHFPSLALGPIAEHLLMNMGITF